jgi:chromosome segregation ATPase
MESPVDVARALESRDEALAAAIAELLELEQAVDRIRRRAEEIEALRARLPEQRAALQQRLADAREELERRRTVAREAEEALARGEEKGDAEQIAAARRAVVRTNDEASMAEKRVARLEQLTEDLERRSEEDEREAPTLEARAAEVALHVAELSRVRPLTPPAPGVPEVIDWAGRAKAALFVARNGLERERESVVREANELAAAILGEPMLVTSVTTVRRRLEESR